MGIVLIKCHICGKVTKEVAISNVGVTVIRIDTCEGCKKRKKEIEERRQVSMHFERPRDRWNEFTTFLAYWIARLLSPFLKGR